jgi:Pyruvate/2-oxoacid:ferredoxin oxidoreductase delta subunit
MNLRNTTLLIICLIFTGWTGLIFLSMAAEHEMIIMYGGFYSSLFFCALIYLVGIRSAIPKDKRPDHKMKVFYFYPLFLHVISNLIYSYLGITMVRKTVESSDQGFFLTLMFAVSLGSFIMFYIAGMIITNRHVHNKNLYINKDLFMISLSYAGPAIPLSFFITYILKDAAAGIFISTIIAFTISVFFCYLGIFLASGGNQEKPKKYKFLILSVYLLYVIPACAIIPLFFIPLFKGEFLLMWAGFLSTVISFLTIYSVCIMISGYVYRPDEQIKEAIEIKKSHSTGDAVYFKLREFLDKLPAGYPRSEEQVEIRLLKKLFTPEEARIATQMRFFPEPTSMIAERCGLKEAESSQILGSMNKKGLIRELKSGKRPFYMASQYAVGIFEDQLKTMDKEYAEMNVRWIANYYQAGYQDNLLRQFRVVPVNKSVDSRSVIASYEQIGELVKKQKLASVMPCICRKQMEHMEIICDKPHETCLTFDFAAEISIDKGLGRKIRIEEALGIIDQAEKAGLVLMTTNAKEIINICCCCGCCCGVLQLLKVVDRPVDHIHSAFQAEIDSSLCKKCKICMDRCQVAAIIKNENSRKVNKDRCIGCGLCVSTCPTKAIVMTTKDCTEPVPKNYMDMLTAIAKKRGLGYGNLNTMMKISSLPLAIKTLPLFYMSGLGKPVVNQMSRWGWI